MSIEKAIVLIQNGICNLDRDERKEAYDNFIKALAELAAKPEAGEFTEDIREKLAKLSHEQWLGWIEYMFGKCHKDVHNATLIVPKWAVERWTRQSETAYCDLSEKEKESDRTEADKFIAIIDQQAAELKPQAEEIKQKNITIRDLAMLIKRLCSEAEIQDNAMDYLDRKGLMGSVTR